MMDTLVVIPAYNEEASIERTIRSLLEANVSADVLVVNDGSVDNTASIISRLPVYVIHHPINLGYGSALQSGYQFAAQRDWRYVAQFDADGQHATQDLKHLIDEIHRGDADVIVGSRFLGNPHFHPGAGKMIAIRLFRKLIRWLTGRKVTDPTSGLRALSKRAFHYYSSRGTFPSDFPDANIIIHMLLNRFVVKEFPIGAMDRTEGVSMHSGLRPLIYMVKVTLNIFAVLMSEKVFRGGQNKHV
jgi:hypothetical protein